MPRWSRCRCVWTCASRRCTPSAPPRCACWLPPMAPCSQVGLIDAPALQLTIFREDACLLDEVRSGRSPADSLSVVLSANRNSACSSWPTCTSTRHLFTALEATTLYFAPVLKALTEHSCAAPAALPAAGQSQGAFMQWAGTGGALRLPHANNREVRHSICPLPIHATAQSSVWYCCDKAVCSPHSSCVIQSSWAALPLVCCSICSTHPALTPHSWEVKCRSAF